MAENSYFNLTNPQKNIWNMGNFFEGTSICNVCGIGLVHENVDTKLFAQAMKNVVKENDCFRLVFELKDGEPVQKVTPYKDFDIEIIKVADKFELHKLAEKITRQKFETLGSCLFDFKIAVLPNKNAAAILTVNHLIGDSWSMGKLILQEVVKEYHALKENCFLDEPHYSYIEYILSENDYKKSKKFETDKAYWNEVFSTIPEQVTIPSFKKIIKNISCKAKRKTYMLNAEIVDGIKTICNKDKVSVFNFFMSIYSIYLSCVSNQNDFVIGTTILNRSNFKEKQTMGMFVNTIPVRITMPENGNFIDFSKGMGMQMMQVLKHQRYAYSQIIEDIRNRNSNITNLYNVLISYQITKAYEKEIGNYEAEWIFNGYCANDLNIHISDINDTGNLFISYDFLIDKYATKEIDMLHERIISVIKQVINNKDISISKIEIVTEKEKERLLSEFNNTNVNYPKNKTVVDLFEEQVKLTPNNIAIVYQDNKLTYQELNEKANSLANYLILNGIKPKSVIGIRLDKSLEMIIGILAIIKAGCCYLPINMQYPKDRVEFMLSDSNAELLLGTKESLGEFSLPIKSINISLSELEIYNNENQNLKIEISPEDLIYIIYTSGSTGKPKGAMLCNRNVVRLIKNDKFLFDFSEKDVWTMFHSMAFDFSVWEMYGALLYGGKLVLVPDDIAKDPNLFLDLLNKEQVTVLNQTPTYFYNLQKCEIANPHKNLKIRYIIFGGEALKPNMLVGWHEVHSQTKLINMYGITETTVHVTFKELLDKDLSSSKSSIGMPIPTLRIMLLDNNLRLVPPGVPGEICVCGEGVFKGYLNREDLNKIKIIKNPYNTSEIMYRSADSGVMNENYCLEYIGRMDKQVKIRGFRIELGEIEEKILECPEINSCVVKTKKSADEHELLCAYYIENSTVDLKKLKDKLKKDLPTYMIPQYFIKLENWPLNHNGKIDTKRLPEPQYKLTGHKVVAPRNEIDKIVVNILKDILRDTAISMDSNFFDIGGDSLSAINLCVKVQDKLHVKLQVKDIIDNPEIEEISNIISMRKKEESNSIVPVKKSGSYEISSAQKRIYLATQVAGNAATVYNIPGGVIFDSCEIDDNKLEKCIKILLNRHETLRTYFELKEEKIVQKISEIIDFQLERQNGVDYEKLNSSFKEFVKPFNLAKAPLFRAKFIKFTNGKCALFIDMHHIISDGMSLSILIDELSKLYNGTELPTLKITYKDFTQFENDRLHNGAFKQAEEYWLQEFKKTVPTLDITTNNPRPIVQEFDGSSLYKEIDVNRYNKIKTISKNLGITPYMFLLSAFYILISKLTAKEDIVIGSPVIGRELEQTYNLVGMFVNTLALRCNIETNKSIKDFMLYVKQKTLEAFKYQSYPFDELVEKLKLKRDTSRNPLFDMLFVFQNDSFPKLDFNGIDTEYYIPDVGISKFDLSIKAICINNKIKLCFEYATKLFNKEFMENIAKQYLSIIDQMIENINIRIEDITVKQKSDKNALNEQLGIDLGEQFRTQTKEKNKTRKISEDTIILPRNQIEEKLINIVQDLLNADNIGINNNFFDLGGDSFSAINLCVRIKEIFNTQLFVRDILENPTIQEISDLIHSKEKTIDKEEIKPVSKAECYQVSSAQRRIFFASQLAGNITTLYNISAGVILNGNIDEEKLEKCFNKLIRRHESLRTYFELNNENVVQKILENVDFKLEKAEDCDFDRIDTLFKEFVRPFNLKVAPLFRAKLLKFTNNKCAIFVDMHHIISDGTSLTIITDEICKLYNGEIIGEPKITYKDYAAFENERLASEKMKEAEDYWKKQFKGDIPVLNLPFKGLRRAVKTYEGKKIYSNIDAKTGKKIQKLANELEITPYMILLSCYYIMLSKYSNQEDIVVGTPIVGRDATNTFDVIGMFVNTLALRNKVDNNLLCKDFVLKIKENLLQSYKYQTYPFDELVNKLEIKRDTSKNPLFDTMFIYQNMGYSKLNFDGIDAINYLPDTHISKFDLTLQAIPNNSEIELSLEYDINLFADDFAEKMLDHYINILKEMLTNINLKISDICALSKDEEAKILYGFNKTEYSYPKDRTIHEIFKQQAQKTPDNVAVVFGDNKLTYRELNEKANALAYYLRVHQNVKSGDLIGIMLNRSLDMIIAILAVLKAGAAYIPIDPGYPKDRIYYMLNSSKASILLTQAKLEEYIDYDQKVVIDLDEQKIYKNPIDNLENVNSTQDLAYVIFTSGSTGQPKGVMLKHQNIINFIYGMIKEFNFKAETTVVSITTISFDIFVLESLMPLLNGFKVVIANEEEQTNVKLFNELCIKNNVDVIQTTPSRIQAFMQNEDSLEFIKNATHILIGGEPFPEALLDKLKEITDSKIYNMYGPTETAVWSSLKELKEGESISIGKPIINTEIYVLNNNLKPQPIGVPGNIYISR